MRKDVTDFLQSVLPEDKWTEIGRFDDLFGEIRWGPDKSKRQRLAEISLIDRIIQSIGALSVDEEHGMVDGFEVRKESRELSDHTKRHLEIEGIWVDPERAIAALNDYREMLHIWNDGNPRTKGMDVHANNIAEAISFAFDEINEPVTEGTKKVHGQVVPSTRFGKVVKYALEYHEVGASWISPHRIVARKWKQGWRANTI